MDFNKARALRKIPVPTSKAEIETVLDMNTYLQKLAPNMAELNKPMRQLITKDTEFAWGKPQQNAFDMIKDIITQEPDPVLAYFDPKKHIVAQADVSKHGLGGALLRDGKPVCFASKSQTPTEISSAQITKELYSVLLACKRFHQMVYGKRITVQTDHRPLLSIPRATIT